MLGKKETGIGRYTQNLIRYLVKSDTENQYVLIINKDSSRLFMEEKDNLKVVKVKYSPLSLYTLFWLHRKIKKEKIDLYHSPFFLAPLWAPCPVIITVHDLMGLKFPDFFEGRNIPERLLARWFVRLFVPMALRRASKIIAVSDITGKELVNYLSLSGKKIEVIYEGVEFSFRRGVDILLPEKIKNKFRITKRIILYVGNTRHYKNLPRLIKAFKLLQKGNKSYQLVIGSGDERNMANLKKIVNRLNLEQDVVFTGPLEDKDIVALMNSAELFVFPSLWEGFGLPPLEAMACGLPVVASKAGSLPEVLGDAAILVNPESEEDIANGIREVLSNKVLKDRLIKKGFERAKLFTWERTAEKTRKVFLETKDV